MEKGRRTYATVVGINEIPIGFSANYQPILEYTAFGLNYTTLCHTQSFFRRTYKIAQVVEIAYDADNPEDFAIVKISATEIILSTMLLACGVYSILRSFRAFLSI